MLQARGRVPVQIHARRCSHLSTLQPVNAEPALILTKTNRNSSDLLAHNRSIHDPFLKYDNRKVGMQNNITAIMGTFRDMISKINNPPTPTSIKDNQPSKKSLKERQIEVELEQGVNAAKERAELLMNLQKIGQSTSTHKVQRSMITWYEPVVRALQEEVKKIEKRVSGVDRSVYGPYLLLLPLEKVALITLDTVLGYILRCGNHGVKIVNLLSDIGSLLETELNLERLRAMKDSNQAMFAVKKLTDLSKNKKDSKRIYQNVRKVLNDQDGWSLGMKTKIGGFLVETLIREVKLANGEPVFICRHEFNPCTHKKFAVLHMSVPAFQSINDMGTTEMGYPRLLPMLVPPAPWNNRQYYGAYLHLKAPILKHTSRYQVDVVRRANIKPVLDGLDYLGKTPWRVNKKVYEIVAEAVKRGMELGEIPSRQDMPLPKEEDFLSEGEDKKKNRAFYNQMCKRVSKRNAELHSLRCDMEIKLKIADKFVEDVIYFPHNLDFRGRAYPVPPNLCHIGSDLCRGLLVFAEAKPLGEIGLKWLKIHLANLCGYNKVPYEQRVAWVDAHMSTVIESSQRPLDGEMWWSKTESPFQALAACIELANAYELPDPTSYRCSLPVHQDGSCNGLQHYAGLGRDELGGRAVNLAPSETPQDVYSKVLEIVNRKVAEDELIPADHPDSAMAKKGNLARLVRPAISRKVIKQTVMTSVYGVTAIGAKLQILGKLEEFFMEGGVIMTPDQEQELALASKYIAKITLESLREMFKNAKEIMDWLGVVSNRVAAQGHTMSWLTPLNLPVIQPYRKQAKYVVRTVMQRVVLAMSSDYLPVETRKQKSAFPPNFVHSLDSTHMLLTSLRMKERGLTFASVHDSFWTHACDAPILAKELRESFIDLYEHPILENLKDSIERRYPDVEIPPLPKRGSLDIKLVAHSDYFFH